MELKELIERLELAHGCLIGSNVSGITPINQFESIINDLKKVKKLTIPDVVASLPVLNRCECCEPQEEPIKICTNCNGYLE